MGVLHVWRFDLTPDAVRQLSPRLRGLTDCLERLVAHSRLWGDAFLRFPVQTEPFERVSEIARLLGIPTRGIDESMNVAIRSTIRAWPARDHNSVSEFVSLGLNLFEAVNRLIAAGYNNILPPDAKAPLPSEQLLAQIIDLTLRFEKF